ncbi:MAG: hypothetical protein LBC02_13755 [Planctomycetaceae bacterium]|jgi:hypothetical protein|nr:hypothetical protein [Planctomycetaceae bacterium]
MKKTATKKQRQDGMFYTPLPFAKKALEYIEQTLGESWWASGEYRLWDMAAGTGNLEHYLLQDALKYCYLSTLYQEDVEYLQRFFSDCEVFQYDYLNDDADNVFADNIVLNSELKWKMPEKLRNDLTNPKLKWIILINPPFATASAGLGRGSNKENIAVTKVRQQMNIDDLGEVSRELFSQFIYRIKYEFEHRIAYLGLFAKVKYINSNNDEKLRKKIFQFLFENGFIFSSVNFHGTSRNNQFPVSFALWKLSEHKQLELQKIQLDILDEHIEKIGVKQIVAKNKEKHLNRWIVRPPATIKFPPFSSAITVGCDNIDRRDRIAEGFLASLRIVGNDFLNQKLVYLLSAPAVSAGALSVTPENFEQAMVVHAARRLPKATWLNDRDQFMQPNQELSEEFVTDCTVWNLFCNSNQTVSLCNVKYEGKIYRIHNHFFPFKTDEVKKWDIADNNIKTTLFSMEDTFVAEWLSKRKWSSEVWNVWNQAKEIYCFYFANLNNLHPLKFKIETYDAGWWQIRHTLQDAGLGEKELTKLKQVHNKLREKLLPKLKEYGIIEG